MEDSFSYQLWDRMSNAGGAYYCVAKNGKWAVITIQHKKIEQVTDYEYDDCSPFVHGAAIVRQNGKYGYLLTNINTNKMQMVPCVLDDAHEFAIKNTAFDDARGDTEYFATVIYQGRPYEMDKKGNLCVEKKSWIAIIYLVFTGWIIFFIGIDFLYTVLYNVIFNGMSFNEVMRKAPFDDVLTTIIIAIVSTIGISKFMSYLQDYIYIYVPKMNIASLQSDKK